MIQGNYIFKMKHFVSNTHSLYGCFE